MATRLAQKMFGKYIVTLYYLYQQVHICALVGASKIYQSIKMHGMNIKIKINKTK